TQAEMGRCIVGVICKCLFEEPAGRAPGIFNKLLVALQSQSLTESVSSDPILLIKLYRLAEKLDRVVEVVAVHVVLAHTGEKSGSRPRFHCRDVLYAGIIRIDGRCADTSGGLFG